MSKKFIVFIMLLLGSKGFSQSNQLWQGYFSFNQITDMSASDTALYASSENAFFSKNSTTNDITTTTTVDGLKAETITALYHSNSVNKTLVGNSNGLLLVVNQDGKIFYKTGILDEVPVSPSLKKINHFNEYNGKVYISCDYGISVFNLSNLEFEQTYYMGPQGSYISVQQTCISNGFIYAATKGNALGSGIRKANLSNAFLDDFNQWIDQAGYEWNGIVTFANDIIAIRTDNKLFRFNGSTFVQFVQMPENGLDLRVNDEKLIVTTLNHVYVYDGSLLQTAHIQSSQVTTIPVTFTCATVSNGVIYIGTNENGVLSLNNPSPTSFQFIMPDGPERNKIFRIRKSNSALWVLYGRYNRTYNPYNLDPPYGVFEYPISKYIPENGWSSIPFSNLLNAKSLSNIAFNPNNDKEFYVSSYFSGLLKIQNDVPITLYNTTNTGIDGLQSLQLSPPNPSYIDIRVNGPAFDKNGNLWMTNNFVTKPLKVLKSNGQWQSYDFTSVESVQDLKDTSYGLPAIDKNGTKWLTKDRNGLIGFNENYGNKFISIKTGTNGNLPVNDVRCVAIDNKNQLWIGTTRGLRIITSVDSFISEVEIQTKAIIILEEDLAQELFYEQFIVDIAVDGANRKWVSIAESGVYLVSPNGQETIYHFTKENSPLPNNTINDIEIDGITGEVFFATDKGLVSFKGTSTKPSDNLENVYVYPNPVRPGFAGTVKISGLTNKAVIKITDIEGNLVYETTSEGGTIEWDTMAFGKYKVASGVYMILISAQDGIDTTVKKVMIIR